MIPDRISDVIKENQILRNEIRVAREAAEITAHLVVKQFQETERILRRFQQSNAQRKAVLDAATQIAIIATDSQGLITVFNTGAENLLGYRAEEIIGKETPLLFHTDDELQEAAGTLREICNKPVAGVDIFLETARQWPSLQREWTYVRNNGAQFPVEMSINLLREQDYAISGMMFIAMDISAKKISEQACQESEQKYRALFDSNPNPIFVLDPETLKILDVNPMALEAYEYRREELVGLSFASLGDMKENDEHFSMIRKRQYHEGVKSLKVRQFKKGGKPFYVNFRTCPMEYHGREAAILTVDDITEMLEKDALLIQAGKMTILGEMSAGVAHELNQPLNAIRVGNEFLKVMAEKDRQIPLDELKLVADEVTAQVDRAAAIINRLKAFGRKAECEKEPVDINVPVNGVLGMIGRQLALENITVTLELEKNLPPVIAHENRMEQVLFNLITNARDAIGDKRDCSMSPYVGNINIRSYRDGDMVAVEITDNGAGMSQEVQERIFEPFFTTKEVGKGMGLGLSIIYGIIRDYGGRIEVQSKEGAGSVFTFFFPVEGAQVET
ncbi:PAS domain-containing sensor histidine kinase [Desulfatibacillum aliphaticivorans]|uniref:PAS domain-containing sensor histidine kinase n=1 Tax=Desulfatibacillum aliphaticivorans TaxID=218208 RepID=UPI000421A7E2|nr:PAS domain S-box protein [Desulfatibacillum aliphaticivorans]